MVDFFYLFTFFLPTALTKIQYFGVVACAQSLFILWIYSFDYRHVRIYMNQISKSLEQRHAESYTYDECIPKI